MLTSVRSQFKLLKDKPYGPLALVDKTIDDLADKYDAAPEIDQISSYLEHALDVRLSGLTLICHRYYFTADTWKD